MGTKNQGWKDSGDAIVYQDGRPVPAPIATCEIQGYWYCAQQLMGLLAWVKGDRTWARELWRAARDLKRRFNADFWMGGGALLRPGLDPRKRLVPVVTSNGPLPGLRDHRPRARARRRLAADGARHVQRMGVRTLSTKHPSYNPLSYHLGSVWAVENATICFALRRYGFDAEAARIAEGLFDLARTYTAWRIPETLEATRGANIHARRALVPTRRRPGTRAPCLCAYRACSA
jgi:glycogen debranching enzyme